MNEKEQREACRKKTEKGNVYEVREDAQVAAVQMSCKIARTVVAFACRHCGKYHIGKAFRVHTS